ATVCICASLRVGELVRVQATICHGRDRRRSSVANPKYVWWNGELVEWDRATVHVTAIGWSAVGAVFEGIRAYWNPDQEELYVFRLPEHMHRLGQSMKMMRHEPAWSIEHLTEQIIELLKANEIREDTYIR